MKRRSFLANRVLMLILGMTAVASLPGTARGAAKDVDLNGDGTLESTVNLTVVTTSPVKVQDKVTNKAVGQGFRFAWPSAGPGGFSSSLALGTTSGVGAIWTWQTTRQVYSYTGTSCTNDICTTRTTPADGALRGPFSVPGRSLSTAGVTTTSESLTSTLVTFFSPPQQLFSITSSVEQLAPGVFRYKKVIENNTGQPITVNQSSGPYGCDTNCGNGVREGGEICDGSDLGGASCLLYNSEGTLGCSADCRSYDLSACVPAQCGNGVREAHEQCDGTDLGGADCGSIGGDALGEPDGILHCTENCTFDIGGCPDVCGNGIREGAEACDGSDFGGETCESQGAGTGSGFNFSGFDGSTACNEGDGCLIHENGSAFTTLDDASRPVLRLTPASGNQAGSAYYRNPQPVSGGFTTTFTFRLSNTSIPPADGLAFVVQNSSLEALGGGGQLMGYNYPNSMAVEFDTYTNGDGYDPNANHVSVQSCGTSTNSPNHPGSASSCTVGLVNDDLGFTLADGSVHTATITYDPQGGGQFGFKGLISLYIDGNSSPSLETSFDLSQIGLGGNNEDHAWVGFTAATGASFENHDILSWSFTPTVPDSSGALNCSGSCQIDVSQCGDICGNNVIDPGEECDGYNVGEHSCEDQGGVGTVGCSSDCHLQYDCTDQYCGNGVRDGSEACDGSDLGDNDCGSLGGGGGPLGCDYTCGFDLSHCTNICGNGVREGEGESCDGSDFGGLTCADFGGNAVDGHLLCVGCSIDSTFCNPNPPDCDSNPTSNIVPPAGSDPGKVEVCEISAHPAKEITTKIDVCGSAIPDGPDSCGSEPATSGTANVFVPDLDTVIGPIYFTTKGIQVVDPDGDGLPKAGHTVQLTIPLMNVGLGTATNVHAVLSSPAYDIDGDGVPDPVTISQPASDYPGAPCFVGPGAGTGDCDTLAAPPIACANLTPFVVTFPDGHPIDISRKFTLEITYSEAALGSPTNHLFSTPFVLGVGGVPPVTCGNSILEPGEDCDDGNTANGDCCSSTCAFESAGSSCADDANPCTADACDGAAHCTHTGISGSCDDGDPCTAVDACSDGHCVGTGSPSCNDGNICTDDSCVTGVGCSYTSNNTCGANPKGQGYWKRICAGPHPSGEFISPVDVECVNDTCTFDDVHTVEALCAVMTPTPPNDKCAKAESHFMSLLLNVCRGRVGRFETTQSSCGHNTSVDQAIRDADTLLCSPSRNNSTCTAAQCETEEIDNGKALGVTSLRVTAARTGPVSLTWGPPYTDSGFSSTIKYRVWRRINSNVPFTQLTETTGLAYTDTTANGTAFQYEVTVVW